MTTRETSMPYLGGSLRSGGDGCLDAGYIAGKHHKALAAESHGQMNAEQGHIRGLDGRVRRIDNAGRGEGFDDADGLELFDVVFHRH